MKKYLSILLAVTLLVSCSEYQNVLKSNDPELKYNKAVEYFEKNDFMRATTLFDEVSRYYRGTERSELVLNYLARSYMGQKDYFTASEYYKTYVKTYPKGKFIIEARYMIGYCYYLDSPDARLDQTTTHNAIKAFQEFLDLHPESERVPQANKLLDELTNKLAYKELLTAKLYYNLGNYLGNNYLSAVIVAQNALLNYPSNAYREEFSFIILQSKYQQAVQSFEDKKMERFRDTIDEYYNYTNEFPEGKYRKDADKILADSKRTVKD
ncbi:MAG TPA: outer membrane protein assembly factor BamD [Paludibacter sp.]|nr:MAG: Outer membrane protein assembly factor BamD [Bacteroidetes bacterium ADurb.Bin174]HQB28938.1 outer membrane protein assembly factor BamD [Paludibacter sp.]